MKKILIAALFLFSSALASGQMNWSAAFVASRCGAAPIAQGTQAERVKTVAQLLDSDDPRIQTYLIDSRIVNAWAVPVDGSHVLVCIPVGLANWLKDSDGELAFFIAHEFGHGIDEACGSAQGRAKLAAKSKNPFTLLFGKSNGDELGDSRRCEMRADLRAFMLMADAGIDTEYAIAALKRLQEARKDHHKGTFGRLFALNSTHPLLSDRIKQMESLQQKFRDAGAEQCTEFH